MFSLRTFEVAKQNSKEEKRALNGFYLKISISLLCNLMQSLFDKNRKRFIEHNSEKNK